MLVIGYEAQGPGLPCVFTGKGPCTNISYVGGDIPWRLM